MFATTAQLVAAANQLTEVAEQIDGRHRVAREEVESLVTTQWRGIAPVTHRSLWESWDGGYGEVVSALRSMAEKIRKAAADFTSTDDSNAAALHISTPNTLNLDTQ